MTDTNKRAEALEALVVHQNRTLGMIAAIVAATHGHDLVGDEPLCAGSIEQLRIGLVEEINRFCDHLLEQYGEEQ